MANTTLDSSKSKALRTSIGQQNRTDGNQSLDQAPSFDLAEHKAQVIESHLYTKPSKNMRITEGVDLIEGEKRLKGEPFKRDHRISMQEYRHQSEVREKELNSIDSQSNADSSYKLDPSEDMYS